MAVSQAKQKILKKIRQALAHPVPLPFPQSEGNQSPFHPIHDEDAVVFAEAFTHHQGKFVFCADNKEVTAELMKLIGQRNWKNIFIESDSIRDILKDHITHYPDLATCDIAITTCECLVARTGSIVLSALQGGRAASAYCPVHICIAYGEQLMPDLKEALLYLKKKYKESLPSSITFATGPSRTADIEKTLVTGVHGPKEVYCFLTDSK